MFKIIIIKKCSPFISKNHPETQRWGGKAAADIEETANPRKNRGSGLTDPILLHHL